VPPALRMIGSRSCGQRTATMPPSSPNSTGRCGPGQPSFRPLPFPPDRLGRQMHGRMARHAPPAMRLVVRPPACSLARTAPCLEVASGPSRGAFAPIREDDRSFAPPRRPEPRLATKCGGCLGAPLVGSQLAPPRAAAPIAPGT
jgi:hypothetical protein